MVGQLWKKLLSQKNRLTELQSSQMGKRQLLSSLHRCWLGSRVFLHKSLQFISSIEGKWRTIQILNHKSQISPMKIKSAMHVCLLNLKSQKISNLKYGEYPQGT